nr:unnamed protein product [Callosobruchus analis]
MRGKNGHKWSIKRPVISKRVSSRNIAHFTPGSKGESPKNTFCTFFTATFLISLFVTPMKKFIGQFSTYAENSSTVSKIFKGELLAFLGILILSAAKKDNHLNARLMFKGTISRTFYPPCMGRERFTFLVNCLRFDDKNTRAERRKTDTFTLFLRYEICLGMYAGVPMLHHHISSWTNIF